MAKGTRKRSTRSSESLNSPNKMVLHLEEANMTDLQKRLFRFSSESHIKRFNFFNTLEFIPARYIDIESLASLGIEELVMEKLTALGFKSFVNIRDPAYYELSIQFITTFCVVKDLTNGKKDLYIYKLMGTTKEDTLDEFNVNCGFIEEEELTDESYRSAVQDTHPNFHPDAFWAAIARDPKPFQASVSKSRYIRVPYLRYLQRYFAHSILGRKVNPSLVSRDELFLLWCAHYGVRVNVGYWFGLNLSQVHGGIMFGSFVTHLAKTVGVYTPEKHRESLCGELHMEPFNLRMMENLHICWTDKETGQVYLMDDCSAQGWEEKLAKEKVEVPMDVTTMMRPRVGESGSSQRHWSTLTIEQIAQFMLDLQTQVAKLNAAVFPQNMFTEETPQPEASHDSSSEFTFSPDERYERVKRLKKEISTEPSNEEEEDSESESCGM